MAAEDEYRGPGVEAAPDLLSLQTLIANVCFVGRPGARAGEWVLVDAALAHSGEQILQAAAERFGPDCQARAIILTHGHFDHVGAVRGLCDRWGVRVYAHELELPYLKGEADYPPPDPTVGGGLMSLVSPLYPNEGIDLGDRVRPLPADGSVPGLAGWRWIHTPGHTSGHISLFRDQDRVLIAGDALITVRQESALAVLLRKKEIHAPPAYFTVDWRAARESVQRLEALEPSVVVAGHGLPMRGEALSRQLEELARAFDRIAIPDLGRYVSASVPAAAENRAPLGP